VSAQSFRYWLRMGLETEPGTLWRAAPVRREGKIAYTDANPIEYWDDDLFGYMRAQSKKADSTKDAGASPLEKDREIDRPDWLDAFRSPAFCVILGRSQDLATITRCDRVTLRLRDAAYFEHTLLPFSLRPHLGIGTTITMARHIDNAMNRKASFDRFIVLRERAFGGPGALAVNSSQRMLNPPSGGFWVDDEIPRDRGYGRGVWFHSFTA
jgi:hypothetical protein